MREILFRGKLKNGKGWAFGNLHVDKTGCTIITPDETLLGIYGPVDPETVGQYTGLTDKNGVKIFEGDICKDSLGWVFEVLWDNENARFIGRHSKPRGDTYICYVGRIPAVEVIGNIYDQEALT